MSQFPMLEELVVAAASRKAEIALTVTETAVGLDIVVDTEKPLTPELRTELAVLRKPMRLRDWFGSTSLS